MRTTDERGRILAEGTVRAGRMRPIAERRWFPGGKIDWRSRTQVSLPIELVLSGGVAEGDGRFHTEVLVDAKVRLRVEYRVGDDDGEILAGRSVGPLEFEEDL